MTTEPAGAASTFLVADFCGAVKAELPAFGATYVKSIGDALMLRVPEPADVGA